MEPGVRRLPALRGAERGEGRESDSGRQLGALEIPQVRVPAGSRARRRGDGFPSLRPSSLRHTPFPGPRSPPARVRRGQSLSFPGPVAAGWVPGSPVGAREVSPSLTGAWAGGRAGGSRLRVLAQIGVQGRRVPWPAGARRANPDEVCQAGLGEQRAGGCPRPVCGLVCDSIRVHGFSKADLHALPGRDQLPGRGRGSPGAAFPRSSAGSELQARAVGSTGAPGRGPLASNFPARSQIYDPTPRPGCAWRCQARAPRRKWIAAGEAAAAGRAPRRRGRGSLGSALRPGAHTRPDRGLLSGRAQPPSLCAARNCQEKNGTAHIGSATRRGSSPSLDPYILGEFL